MSFFENLIFANKCASQNKNGLCANVSRASLPRLGLGTKNGIHSCAKHEDITQKSQACV